MSASSGGHDDAAERVSGANGGGRIRLGIRLSQDPPPSLTSAFGNNMNLAEFTTVLVAICGFVTPAVFALSKGARWWVVMLCALGGILYGTVLGLAAGKTAFWLLDARGSHKGVAAFAFGAYMLFPLPAIALSIVGALGVTAFFVK